MSYTYEITIENTSNNERKLYYLISFNLNLSLNQSVYVVKHANEDKFLVHENQDTNNIFNATLVVINDEENFSTGYL